MAQADSATRGRILRAALKRFAESGYAGTSVQQIVDDARVTKPVLYYYFKSKAGLYQALLDWAQEERRRLMQEAVARASTLADQLVELLAAQFEFLERNPDLVRLAYATAFAARGEIPAEIDYLPQCERNFELVHDVLRQGQADGAFDQRYESRDLALALYGMMSMKVMEQLVNPHDRPDRRTAQTLVDIFLKGAQRPRARSRSNA
jgi:TetR/AcrR family transcriptional regulator